MLTQARRQVLTAGMIFALGFALVLGGCGHLNQSSQNGANQTTTTQPGGTTTGSTTPGGTTTGGTPINNAQDLQNLDNSLSAAFSDLEGDRTAATTDYSQLDQGGQP